MPEIFRSFHYWQPAPRWRLPLWLANHGTQPWDPIQERDTVPITLNKQWKEGGKGWRKLSGKLAATPHSAASSHSKHTPERLKRLAHGIPTDAHKQKKADYQRMLMLVVVVNSIKLHLTAFKRGLSIEALMIH